MRGQLLLAGLLLVLAGCDSLTHTGADGFEVGPRGFAAYETDERECGVEADTAVDYGSTLVDASFYERNRAYNREFSRCMMGRGHRLRPYLKNMLPDLASGQPGAAMVYPNSLTR